MEKIELELKDDGKGIFTAYLDEKKMGEMEIILSRTHLRARHTGVEPAFRGQGIAKKLFDRMVSYARLKGLKVIAECPFTYAQFNRQPELYKDIRSID